MFQICQQTPKTEKLNPFFFAFLRSLYMIREKNLRSSGTDRTLEIHPLNILKLVRKHQNKVDFRSIHFPTYMEQRESRHIKIKTTGLNTMDRFFFVVSFTMMTRLDALMCIGLFTF